MKIMLRQLEMFDAVGDVDLFYPYSCYTVDAVAVTEASRTD